MAEKIALAEATAEQLRAFALNEMGLNIHPSAKTATIISKLKAAGYANNFIEIDENAVAQAGAQEPARALRATSSKNDPVVMLTINEAKGPGGKRPVPVGVNGSVMLIPRGKSVPVPYRYYETLRNAVETDYDLEESGEITERDVPSYPFQVDQMPSQAEVEAWRAKNRAKAA